MTLLSQEFKIYGHYLGVIIHLVNNGVEQKKLPDI